jgi:hypothetical protein
LLSFAYVYFFESGLFNGLRPIQIKKFPRLLAQFRSSKNARSRPPRWRRGLDPAKKKNLTHISGFGNDMHSWLEALGAHPYGSYSRFSSWPGQARLVPAMTKPEGGSEATGEG